MQNLSFVILSLNCRGYDRKDWDRHKFFCPSLGRGAGLSPPQLFPAGMVIAPGCSLTSSAAVTASNLVQKNPSINLFVIGHFRHCKWGGKWHDSWWSQAFPMMVVLLTQPVTHGGLQSPEKKSDSVRRWWGTVCGLDTTSSPLEVMLPFISHSRKHINMNERTNLKSYLTMKLSKLFKNLNPWNIANK